MTELRIFGAYHFNTRSIVTDDLREYAAGADAIAIEDPRLGNSVSSAIGALLRYPVAFVGVQLMGVLLQVPLFALFNRDLYSTEQLAARDIAAGRPVHSVDRHPVSVLTERDFGWVGGNWIAFGVLAAEFPVAVAGATGAAVAMLAVGVLRNAVGFRRLLVLAALVVSALSWELLVRRPIANDSVAFFVPVVLWVAGAAVVRITLEQRNEVMLEDVATLASEHGYDRICLTTGKSHVPGMVDVAASFGLTTVDVFEPKWRRSGRRRDPETVAGPSGWEPRDDSDDGRVRMERAGNVLFRRAAATVLDWVLILVMAFAILVAVVSVNYTYTIGDSERLAEIVLVCWLLLPPAYFAISETTAGRTFGKSVAGLTVVRLDGSPCTRRDAVVRTLFRPLDFLPVGYFLGGLVAARNRYGQRIGDRAAGTVVVERDALEAESDDADPIAAESTGSQTRPSRPAAVGGSDPAVGDRREPARARTNESSGSAPKRTFGSATGRVDASDGERRDESGASAPSSASAGGVHPRVPTESERAGDDIRVDEDVFDTETVGDDTDSDDGATDSETR